MNTCLACGVEIHQKVRCGPDRKWCSPKCRVWAMRHPGEARLEERACESCGKDISHMQYNATVCSKRCDGIRRGQVRAESLPDQSCAVCSALFTPSGLRAKYCSAKCRYGRPRPKVPFKWTDAGRDGYHRRRARKKGTATGGPIRRTEIGERDGWRCGICRKRVDPGLLYPDLMSPSLDHVIPLSLGGPHVAANVRITHLTCNNLRGNKVSNEQLALV